MISVLRDSYDCVGFVRSAGPRGFQAYDRRRSTPWLIRGQAGRDRSDYGPKLHHPSLNYRLREFIAGVASRKTGDQQQ
jgi:hypothetical protein